ncbi:MAG: DMT family transporter [Gallionella sp.]|nr:DMT family transporter [Gallionella sp.]
MARIIRVELVPTKQNLRAVSGVLSGALVWGLIWYPYRMLQETGISGALATLITFLLAMLFAVAWLPRLLRELPAIGWWGALLVLSAGGANFGYVLAMLHGDVMRVLLLFYLAPLWTILLSYWLLGEKLNRYGYVVIALSVGGAITMLWRPQHGWPLPQNLSEWIGLSAGLSFALSNVVSRRARHMSVKAKSFSVWLGTAVLTLPLLWYQGGALQQLTGISATHWLVLAILGGVMCAVSYAVQYGVTHLPANRAMLLFLFELVVAAVSSYFLAGEEMQPRDWIGAALIVSASLLSGKLYSTRNVG